MFYHALSFQDNAVQQECGRKSWKFYENIQHSPDDFIKPEVISASPSAYPITLVICFKIMDFFVFKEYPSYYPV